MTRISTLGNATGPSMTPCFAGSSSLGLEAVTGLSQKQLAGSLEGRRETCDSGSLYSHPRDHEEARRLLWHLRPTGKGRKVCFISWNFRSLMSLFKFWVWLFILTVITVLMPFALHGMFSSPRPPLSSSTAQLLLDIWPQQVLSDAFELLLCSLTAC
jgi:hypothetical protein